MVDSRPFESRIAHSLRFCSFFSEPSLCQQGPPDTQPQGGLVCGQSPLGVVRHPHTTLIPPLGIGVGGGFFGLGDRLFIIHLILLLCLPELSFYVFPHFFGSYRACTSASLIAHLPDFLPRAPCDLCHRNRKFLTLWIPDHHRLATSPPGPGIFPA